MKSDVLYPLGIADINHILPRPIMVVFDCHTLDAIKIPVGPKMSAMALAMVVVGSG